MKKQLLKSFFSILTVSFVGLISNINLYAQCEISSGAPIIDNTIESIWTNATVHNINLPMSPTSTPSGFSAQWRCLYTSSNVYFLIEVTKTGSLYNQNGANWWEDDAVELYLDGNHSAGTSYDGTDDTQLGFRYNEGTTVHAGGTNPANSTTGITYSFYTTGVGYNVEIMVPWSSFHATPANGSQFGIEVGVDVSNGSRMTQMTTYNATGFSYNNPSLFGTMTFNTCTIAAVQNSIETAAVTSNPNPFNSQTTLSFPTVGSYVVAVSDLKGKLVKEYSVANDDKLIMTCEGMENGMYVYFVKNNLSGGMYNGKLVLNK